MLYPTYRTGVECDWIQENLCKLHFALHSSIPFEGQKFFNSPKRPYGFCGITCLLLSVITICIPGEQGGGGEE